MAKSQLTFRKKEQAKKKRLKKEDKMERRLMKKLDNDKGKSLEELFVYVDEHGNLSPTPPLKPYKFKEEDLLPRVHQDDIYRVGKVLFYNELGRYGFITDTETLERVYFNDDLAGRKLEPNQKVRYKSSESFKGPQITEIVVL
jgi:CspA family cold shock protein